MAKDRARDVRRSVGSHEKIMGALGKAAGDWQRFGDDKAGRDITIASSPKGDWKNEDTPPRQEHRDFIPGAAHVVVDYKGTIGPRMRGFEGVSKPEPDWSK